MPRPFGTTGFASPSTVPPPVGPVGATYHDASSNLDFVSNGSAWVPISSLYIASRGSGLFANGQGLLGTNYNWAGTYNLSKIDHPVGAPASFQYDSSVSGLALCNEFISVDPAGTYDMSFAFKQVTGDGTRRFYSMLAPYDADKLAIGPNHYLEQANTRTTLAADLNPGATTITLASAANWNNAAGATSQLRNIIVWNYVDGQGYAWPAGTYSRNVVNNAYADGGISGNVITLSAPWSGSAVPAGTPISNGNSGASYMYGALNLLGPVAWTNYSYRYSGVHTNLQAVATTAFPAATSYVKLGFLHNYPPAPLDPTSLQRVSNINLTKIDLPSGPASGVLAGSYPSPIFTTPVAQVLTASAASGWSLDQKLYVQWGPYVEIRVELSRTGADMIAPANGNFAPDIAVLTGVGPPSILPVSIQVVGRFGRRGVQGGSGLLGTTGNMNFTDGLPGVTYVGAQTVGAGDYYAVFQYLLPLYT